MLIEAVWIIFELMGVVKFVTLLDVWFWAQCLVVSSAIASFGNEKNVSFDAIVCDLIISLLNWFQLKNGSNDC